LKTLVIRQNPARIQTRGNEKARRSGIKAGQEGNTDGNTHPIETSAGRIGRSFHEPLQKIIWHWLAPYPVTQYGTM
jgi:hypothetical protein